MMLRCYLNVGSSWTIRKLLLLSSLAFFRASRVMRPSVSSTDKTEWEGKMLSADT